MTETTQRDEPQSEMDPIRQDPAPSHRCGQAIAKTLLLLFITCAATAGVVIYQVQHVRVLSPVDEATYVDYLAKAHDGHFIIGRGEIYGDVAANAVACRGIGQVVKPRPDACNQIDPKPYRPRNTADIDPPTYYVMTDAVARVLMGLGVTDDLVNAGRLAGILWGGAGLAALFLLCGLLGASRISGALVCGIALATTGFWTNWTHITPHATDLLVGALAAIAVIMWVRHRAPTWLLLIVGAAPVAFKASNVTVIAAIVIFLLALALWPQSRGAATPRRSRQELFVGVGLVVGSLAVATVTWLLIRHHYSLTPVNNFAEFNVDAFQPKWLVSSVGTFAQPYQSASLGVILVICVFGSVIYQFSDKRGGLEIRSLSFAVLVVAVFGAWLYIVSNFVLLQQYVVIPNRYGATLMPVLLALTARNIRGRVAQSVGLVYLVLLVVTIYTSR